MIPINWHLSDWFVKETHMAIIALGLKVFSSLQSIERESIGFKLNSPVITVFSSSFEAIPIPRNQEFEIVVANRQCGKFTGIDKNAQIFFIALRANAHAVKQVLSYRSAA
jgi:hypothetical protein